MRRYWVMAALALAACGDTEEPKSEDPPRGWVYCNEKSLGVVVSNDAVKAIAAGKDCNAIRGSLDIGGIVNSLEGLEPILHIQGNLNLVNTDITDLSPLYGLETVKIVSIQGNYELDNCFATALANTLTGDYSRVSDNKGDRICLNLPD